MKWLTALLFWTHNTKHFVFLRWKKFCRKDRIEICVTRGQLSYSCNFILIGADGAADVSKSLTPRPPAARSVVAQRHQPSIQLSPPSQPITVSSLLPSLKHLRCYNWSKEEVSSWLGDKNLHSLCTRWSQLYSSYMLHYTILSNTYINIDTDIVWTGTCEPLPLSFTVS